MSGVFTCSINAGTADIANQVSPEELVLTAAKDLRQIC